MGRTVRWRHEGSLGSRRGDLGHRLGLGRSVRLFRSFLTEQTDPRGFYGLIADDAVDLVSEHVDLVGRTVADFVGGPGFFSEACRAAGARTVLVDTDLEDIRLHGRRTPGSVVALAEQ